MKNNFLLKIFLVLLFINISLSVSDTNEDIKDIELTERSSVFEYETSKEGLTKYRVTVKECDNCFYLKARVIQYGMEDEGEMPRPLEIYFSSDDDSLREYQLMTNEISPNGYTIMHIKRDQYIQTNIFYLGVKCGKYGEKCTYTLEINMEESGRAEIPFEHSYSYFVTNYNVNMTFQFVNSNIGGEGEKKVMSLWARSSKGKFVELEFKKIGKDYPYVRKDFKGGAIVNIYFDNIVDFNPVINLKATPGDYITVGSSYYVDGKSDMPLYPNGVEQLGFIEIENTGTEEKGNTELCFDFKFDKSLYQNKEKIYAYIYIYSDNWMSKTYIKTLDGTTKSQINSIQQNYPFAISPSEEEGNQLCIDVIQVNSDQEPYNQLDTVFKITLIDNINLVTNLPNDINYYLPQTYIFGRMENNLIYNLELPKKTFNVFYIGNAVEDIDKINFNIKVLSGNANAYFVVCNGFPQCEYTEETISTLVKINFIDSIAIQNIERGNENFTTTDRYLLVIQTLEDEYKSSSTSKLQISMNLENIEKTLNIFDRYTEFTNEKGTNYYKFNLQNLIGLSKAIIEMDVYQGDPMIYIENKEGILKIKKYYANSKIFYEIELGEEITNQYISFEVETSNKSTFYSLYISIQDQNNYFDENSFILNGDSKLLVYPIHKDSDKSKTYPIKFINLEHEDEITNFVIIDSLNCKVKLEKEIINIETGEKTFEEISSINNLYYTTFEPDVVTLNDLYLSFRMTISEDTEISTNGKICMLQASSQAIYNKNKGLRKDILISENTPFRFQLNENMKKIRLIYPHVNTLNYFGVYIKIENLVFFSITFGVDEEKSTKTVNSKRSIFIVKKASEFSECSGRNQICPIVTEIEIKEFYSDLNPTLELKFIPLERTPEYLPKNKALDDMLYGYGFGFYYSLINKEDYGSVIVKGLRSGLKVYGKIIEVKDDENSDSDFTEQDYSWRNKYTFPIQERDSIKYDTNLNKLIIKNEDVKKCNDKCYLLISVETYADGKYEENNYKYPITIIPEIINTNLKKVEKNPIIEIKLNEFIVGDVEFSEEIENLKFFQVFLYDDADEVIFDLESEKLNIYVNVGEKRPSPDTAAFHKIFEGYDNIYTLKKEQILKKANIKNNENSIKGLKLTIGVISGASDNSIKTLFALKVKLRKYNNYNNMYIHHIKNTQKQICLPEKVSEESYRCLFAIKRDDLTPKNGVLLYPKIHLHDIKFAIHAHFENSDYITTNNLEELSKSIPDENSKYSTSKTNTDYLYIYELEKEGDIFISVVLEKQIPIELLTSFYNHYLEIQSDSYNSPLYFLREEAMELVINNNEKELSIEIVNLEGKGEIYWNDEQDKVYTLNGFNNKIIITSGNKSSKLIIKNKSPIKEGEEQNNPGLSFYISYYIREGTYNIEEIQFEKSFDLNYEQSNFPVNFYSKLNNLSNDIKISVSFNGLMKDNNELYSDEIFNVQGTLMKQPDLIKCKYDASLIPSLNQFEGKFDPFIGLLIITITKDELSKYSIKLEDDPFLYIKLNVKSEVKDKILLAKKHIQIMANYIIKDKVYSLPQNLYNYGNLNKNIDIQSYEIKLSNKEKYIKIEISTNSKFLQYSVSIEPNQKTSHSFDEMDEKESGGKKIIVFNCGTNNKIYVNIFHGTQKSENSKLNNYAIKYNLAESKDKFIYHNLIDNKIYYTKQYSDESKTKVNYFIDVKKVDTSSITYKGKDNYLLKFVLKNDYIENENLNTIAQTESRSLVFSKYSIKNEGNTIEFIVNNINLEIKYLQVLAEVIDGSEHDFLSFEGILDDKKPITPTPTPSPSPTPTPSPTPSPSPIPTITPSPTQSPTTSPSPTPTLDPSPSPTSTPPPIPTSTPEPTREPSPIPTTSPLPSPTQTDSQEGSSDDKKESKKKLVIIIIVSVLSVVVVVVVVIIVYFKKFKKNIREEVEGESFKNSNAQKNLLTNDDDIN